MGIVTQSNPNPNHVYKELSTVTDQDCDTEYGAQRVCDISDPVTYRVCYTKSRLHKGLVTCRVCYTKSRLHKGLVTYRVCYTRGW